MLRIVTSNNSAIFRQLASPAFRRVGVDHRVGANGAEILSLVENWKPQIVIVDKELPDTTGYEVSRRIKSSDEHQSICVVIVVDGAVTMDVIHELSRSRCDEVLVTPAPGEELFHKIARLVGLPSRVQRRMHVELRALAAAGGRVISGRVLDLSTEGARLELDDSLEGVGQVRVRIVGDGGGAKNVAVATARVIWEQRDDAGRVFCGLQFVEIPPASRPLLEDWSLWELSELPDGVTQVFLQGEFREHTSFERLAKQLSGRVQFDLSGVTYLNSAGVRKWVDFLRAIDDEVEHYTFVRCSVAFVNQASMVPEVLGRGEVVSFRAPYACDDCDFEEERLLQTSALVLDGRWPPDMPSFACPRCGGDLLFDDLPARFFAFLEPQHREAADRASQDEQIE